MRMLKGKHRNQPCPCGSGEKYKRCCFGQKPTTETVTLDYGEPVQINGFRFNNGNLELLKDGLPLAPKAAWVGKYRESKKGEKQLLRIPIDTKSLYFGEAQALLKYNRIFAIDTGNKLIDGINVSVGCMAECRFQKYKNQITFIYSTLGLIEFHGAKEKQENLSWHILIKSIQSSPDYSTKHKYAIITDSDLGNHGKYNDREAPYFQSNYLPENFSLIYAFDKGKSLSNKVINNCDKEATKMIRKFENKEISLDGALTVIAGPCSHFRGWLNSNSTLDSYKWFRLGKFSRKTLDHTVPE